MGENAFDHFFVQPKTESNNVADGELEEIQKEIKRMAERGKKQKKLIKGKEDPTENQAEENKSSRLTQSASSKQLEVVQHAAMEPTVPPTFYMPVSPGERKTSLPRQMSAVPQSSERKFSLRLPDIPERRNSKLDGDQQPHAHRLASKYSHLTEVQLANLWFQQNYSSSSESSDTETEEETEANSYTGTRASLDETDRLKAWILNGKKDFRQAHKLLVLPKLPTTTKPFNFVAEKAEKRIRAGGKTSALPFKYAHIVDQI